MKSITFSALALALLVPLTACSQAPQNAAESGATAQTAQNADETPSSSMISREIQKAMEKAKQELATKNIDVNNVHVGSDHHDNGSHPKAEITPQGDLLIAGNVPAQDEFNARLNRFLLSYLQVLLPHYPLPEYGRFYGTALYDEMRDSISSGRVAARVNA